jgi:predicted MFS family arabinose efflux permease
MRNREIHSQKQVIGAGLAIVASTYGLSRYVIGLFIPDIKATFGLSVELMGAIASCSYVGYLLATVIASIYSFKFGPRYLIIAGGVCAFVGLMLVSLTTNIWLLILGITIAGMSPGLSYPPLSDAIVLMLKQSDRDFAYTVINSGTSIGVIISAPLAILAGENWREAWFFFSIIAIVSTVWNAAIMTRRKLKTTSNKSFNISFSWIFNKDSHELFIYSFFLGIVTSVYWTFSVEYIVTQSSDIYVMNWQISNVLFSKFFWSCVGISGLFGGFASFFVKKFGLRKMTQTGMLLICLSIILLTIFYDNWFFLLFSSLIFGSVFISTTAFIGIWSIHVFYMRPAVGFGLSFFLLTLGQLVGSVLFGIIAGAYGMDSIFYIATLIGIICSFVRANEEIYSMTPL